MVLAATRREFANTSSFPVAEIRQAQRPRYRVPRAGRTVQRLEAAGIDLASVTDVVLIRTVQRVRSVCSATSGSRPRAVQ
jgi:hypothetical protein